MKREDKNAIIEQLTERINRAVNIYVADISNLDADDTSALRRACFKENIELTVVKNTLLQKAMERSNKKLDEMFSILNYNSCLMICDQANVPAKLITEFRRKNEKPVLKAAFVQESVYVGDDQLPSLVSIKSKNELIGDIILALQSPINNVVGALKSGQNTIAGLVKTLSERE